MNLDYQILREDLVRIGLKAGDCVLLHSSYKSMGGLEGGIETFVQALLSVLGDRGTLIAPTLTFASVTEEHPVFDYVHSPCCVGAIPEFIRNMDGAVRSINPTHSCAAIGYRQAYFVAGHEQDCTPIGPNSPIYKLPEAGGKILMLGCGIACNTSMHGVEEKFRTPYVFDTVPRKYTICMPDRTYEIDYFRHHIGQNGYRTQFARAAALLEGDALRSGTIHGAESYLFDAAALWNTGLQALQRDPYFFVDRVEK